jgi:hypothetical protein
VLHAIGRAIDVVLGPIGRWLKRDVLSPIGHGFVGVFGGWAGAVGIALAVGVGALAAVLLVRRRSRISARDPETDTVAPSIDPRDLEHEADRRASMGDYGTALRLRFEAGLLRLEASGLVTDQLVHTDTEVAAHIGSPTFDVLAQRHEAVAYAGEQASADDVEHARTSWPRVTDEARNHRALTSSGRA